MEHQQVNDNLIIDICFQKNCNRYKRGFDFNKLPENIQQYILNRYNDSQSLRETLLRIKYNIDVHPKCPICGNPCKIGGYHDLFLFNQTCGNNICKYKIQSKHLQEKYGYENVFQRDDVKEKIKNTMKVKYGVEHALQSTEIKQKQEETCIKRFGTNNVFTSDYGKKKIKQTIIRKYGVDHQMKSQLVKDKFDWKSMIKHQIETKRKNHTFNTSKIEIESYNILKEKYDDVIYQYYDKYRYPFACDFYIPSLDLFIECNYHWTHGGKPYEGTEKDNKIIDGWKSKNSQYYNNAINCWTIRDVNKRNIAQQNNLNYIEFWNVQELQEWVNQYV